MRIKKRITSLSLITAIITALFGSNVFAADTTNKVKELNCVSKFKEAIESASADGNISEIEKQEILANTSQEVVIAYLNSIRDEINSALSTKDADAVRTYSTEDTNDDLVTSNTYHVNDAVDVVVKIVDVSDVSSSSRTAILTQGGVQKALGDRKTTGTYEEKIFGISYIKLNLTLGYKVNTSNMTARYASTSKSASIGSISSSAEVTDSVAAKIGHDMNCNGYFDINIAGYVGINIGLTLQVKWYSNVNSTTRYITYKLSVI